VTETGKLQDSTTNLTQKCRRPDGIRLRYLLVQLKVKRKVKRMAQYKTPNVYVREESVLPASVAEVATAIPAFIGHTEMTVDAKDDAISLINKPVRITTMDEYEATFGGPYSESIAVDFNPDASEFYIPERDETALAKFFLYQSVQHFFVNGGGACYVVSTGGYTEIKQENYTHALSALEQVDEVTLFVMPETVTLTAQAHYDLHNLALSQASSLQDRFAIIDVRQESILEGNSRTDAAVMRNKVVGDLKYGASYYPYVRTSMARSYDEDRVTVPLTDQSVKILHTSYSYSSLDGKTALSEEGYPLKKNGTPDMSKPQQPTYVQVTTSVFTDLSGYQVDQNGNRVTDGETVQAPYGIFTDADGKNKYLDVEGYETQKDSNVRITTGTGSQKKVQDPLLIAAETKDIQVTLAELNDPNFPYASTAKYNAVKSVLREYYLILPPSAAVTGCIAKIDAARGVWKAPANVALTQVLEPMVTLDNSQQESLNVDEVAGKSVNAIRTFVGKGTLIWGARTLAGNDLEWRYISVRRLFNMVEESLQKATAFAVFEPNTPITWLKLKTMAENYLRNLWQQGALAGSSESEAFFVQAGLGESMTEQDILEGLMKIKIGLAASRPAEFIELTFQHKSLES
jgi:phage tail sheath protein FI